MRLKGMRPWKCKRTGVASLTQSSGPITSSDESGLRLRRPCTSRKKPRNCSFRCVLSSGFWVRLSIAWKRSSRLDLSGTCTAMFSSRTCENRSTIFRSGPTPRRNMPPGCDMSGMLSSGTRSSKCRHRHSSLPSTQSPSLTRSSGCMPRGVPRSERTKNSRNFWSAHFERISSSLGKRACSTMLRHSSIVELGGTRKNWVTSVCS
mmetsp:Transcript_39361/g.92555  ORF Transcript_39361/g.92555 Transcript_39361/m.92555 type:complete len:205 (-) Transcript_39361:1622-2236(-)